MNMKTTPRTRHLLRIFHRETIPRPAMPVYNVVSRTRLFQRLYEVVARDILTHRREGTLLDVGTGPGWLLMKVHGAAPGLRLTGIDISPSMVKTARRNMARARVAAEIEITESNVTSLPFINDSFDMVVSMLSVHHWKDPVAGLNEVHRVLKHGGLSFHYDLVRDTPRPVLREASVRLGRFGAFLLGLVAFVEPFYNCEELLSLAVASLFRKGQGRFVSGLYCLSLNK